MIRLGQYSCKDKHEDGFHYCQECFEKQLIIDRLKEENQQLKSQLRYRKNKDKKPYVNQHTPSSKIEFKKNTEEENKQKQGGRPKGHHENGRRKWEENEIEETITLDLDKVNCPECGDRLEDKGYEYRQVIDALIIEAKKLMYKCRVKACKRCRKCLTNRPNVLPKFTYSNSLIANAVIMHYLEGIPVNKVAMMFGNRVTSSALLRTFHYLATHFETSYEALKVSYRQELVRHADETGWRTDGKSGYSWLFSTARTSVFLFGKTRSQETPTHVLGTQALPGVLCVDRYNGYNKVPCDIQYCYAHLLRDVAAIEKNFPNSKEVKTFVSEFATLLTKAMKLRNEDISDDVYYHQSAELHAKIMTCARAPSQHEAISTYQSIFIDHEKRLFHWVKNRRIPPDNNRAESELRPIVIARKVSFGSQSVKGTYTRSVLMSVLHSVAKRIEHQSIKHWLANTLDALALDSSLDLASLIPKT